MIRTGRSLALALVAFVVMVLGGAVARAEPVPKIVNPITDLAGVIPDEVEGLLSDRLAEHRAKTKVHIAVLTIRSTDGVPIDDYALRAATRWAGGTAGADDGALFVLAVADRQMRLELGYGLEAKIPDAEARRIVDAAIGDLRRDDYGNATHVVIEGVIGRTGGQSRAGTPIATPRKAPVAAPSRFGDLPLPKHESVSSDSSWDFSVLGVYAVVAGLGLAWIGAGLRSWADATKLAAKASTDEDVPIDHVELPPLGIPILGLAGLVVVAGGIPLALGQGVGPLFAALLGGVAGYVFAPLFRDMQGFSGSGASSSPFGSREPPQGSWRSDPWPSSSGDPGGHHGHGASTGPSWHGGGGGFGGGGASSRW